MNLRSFIFLLCLCPSLAHALEMVCDIQSAGKKFTLHTTPQADPYQLDSIDLPGYFRMSIQYLTSRNVFKTYVYHDGKERYVLIHASESVLPPAHCSRYQDGLGLQRVYSHSMERELSFQCRSRCS